MTKIRKLNWDEYWLKWNKYTIKDLKKWLKRLVVIQEEQKKQIWYTHSSTLIKRQHKINTIKTLIKEKCE